MRVKMLERNRAEMEQKLLEQRCKQSALPYERVYDLTRCARDIQRGRNDKDDSETYHAQIVDKLMAIEGRIERWVREIEKVDVWYSAAKRNVEEAVESTIRKLMLELECGGNVRLEEGQPGDIW